MTATHSPAILSSGETDNRPLITVLLVNYNGLVHLEECLSSLRDQSFRDAEVVLVDNASTDGSVDYVRQRFPEVRLVESGANLGFAGGNNFGLMHCRGRYVFFLNNDTKLEPGALDAIARGIRERPDVRVFACLMLRYDDPRVVDNAGEIIYRNGLIYSHAGYPAHLFDMRREVIGACGGAAVYARSLLDEIGAFDEDFFLIFEDVDLSLRARHHGETILFLPDARVLHKGSASIGGRFSNTAVYYSTRNYLPLFLKNFPTLTLVRCAPMIAFSLCLRARQMLTHGRTDTFLRGLRDGLRMLGKARAQRRAILSGSRIGRTGFERLLRPGWLHERRAFRKGDYAHMTRKP